MIFTKAKLNVLFYLFQYAALIKQHIQRYVNSGHDADTPEKICEAICSGDGVPNLVLLLGIRNGKTKEPIFKIKHVKSLHDFRFDNDDILARIVSGIGDGIYLGLGDGALNEYEISSVFEYEIFNLHQLENLKPMRSTVLSVKNPGEVQVTEKYEYEDADDVDFVAEPNNEAVFSCPKPTDCYKLKLYDHFYDRSVNFLF